MTRAFVVIPAHNESDRIAKCLRALAAQTVGPDAFGVVVVLDACRDDTGAIALATAADLGLALATLQCEAHSAGVARDIAMRYACECLEAAGHPDGLIASTDADTQPDPTWIERQLELVRAGNRAIAGYIELDDQIPANVRARRERRARARLDRVRAIDPRADHHHFAGASFGVTARTYRAVGGLQRLPSLEDSAFAQRLHDHDVAILRTQDVHVRTSARRNGRADQGLAVDLDVDTWLNSRRYKRGAFTIEDLARAKADTSIAVVVPAKEVAGTIAGVLNDTVGPLRSADLVDDVLVIDAASADGTAAIAAACGARVVQQDDILSEFGPAQGKGDAMWRAVAATDADVVCFLDADTRDPSPEHLTGLIGPLLHDPAVMFVKGAFERPFMSDGREMANEGGRVTELMARPLLNLHVPRLAGFAQPLAGEVAARRTLLESIPFPTGYGVEIAMLIDALNQLGLDGLAEADLGERRNRHQSLRSLGEMAYAVLAAVEGRIGGGRAVPAGTYMRPWEDAALGNVPIVERPALRTLVRSSNAVGSTPSLG
jgi:glucosyl-3-phosphoglycerate synthase